MSARVLIVDDENSVREFLEIFIAKMGHETHSASNGRQAIDLCADEDFDLVLTDLKMPQADGIQVLETIKQNHPNTQVILMTAYSTTETAIEAMKKGAYDYVAKPFKIAEMRVVIEKALEKRQILQENRDLKHQLARRFSFSNIIGKSEPMQRVFDLIRQIAGTRSTVLISGESGTGKELIARALHFNSQRASKPFVVINCAVIPENLMESEMFGHVRGAFTGATASKKGLFLLADSGTLFLDEIAEMPLNLQVKLLRVLEDRRVKPVGGVKETEVDVRIIAASNRDLESEVKAGNFREDLFYRLNVIQVRLPPLRERKEDIPFIANYFLAKYSQEMGKLIQGFENEVMEHLLAHNFSGNVRELENIVERATAVESSDMVTLASIPDALRRKSSLTAPESLDLPMLGAGIQLDEVMEQIERRFIVEALKKTGGVKTEAAKLLGVSFRAIRYKIDKLSISDDEIRTD